MFLIIWYNFLIVKILSNLKKKIQSDTNLEEDI